ncbi:BadF/BadG/BcrA/BcrD ATPase family protein [Nesterenkonia sp. F]|uniref:BadF/BadG/BcrA/BcrD ATPase family protein n=1 Tax=Nesterenkonia sp. F TaxID=795955 RepID=UPI000255CA4C|nr:BadF/BadG/BcrA/BcrD ATPase family protein [Nesterenkonia sp. F]
MSDLVLGLDVGGTGSRIALAPLDVRTAAPSGGSSGAPSGSTRRELAGPRVRIGPDGSSVPAVVDELLARAGEAWPEVLDPAADDGRLCGVALGATGLASLVDEPDALPARMAQRLRVPAAAAIDAVTAHLGALDGAGGAIVALGTGAVAVGHPGSTLPSAAGERAGSAACPAGWRRVDGWGHLLGDRGGGAWLGRRGLQEALRAHDGVDPAGAALLAAGRRRLGEPSDWPAQLYTRDDRAGVLAGFAADVVELAAGGDALAHRLVESAGREAAASALAALAPEHPARAVLTGGLAAAGGALTAGFTTEIAARRPETEIAEVVGDPLDGALHLARLAAASGLAPQEGFLWT